MGELLMEQPGGSKLFHGSFCHGGVGLEAEEDHL